ncbi:hypothetical protein [Kitasatospora sp. NBC_01302]|uniref:hypothetical protein n=1 Tax=Kitasatospora sp. NBC_01302 TaxID=2903575 RepID=UPI002E0DC0EE|nr:hypothetical protein OG294_40125 [Kitasatospora sp. NBC_01302]
MSTALDPTDLVHQAQHALTAAQAATAVLADHPELPVARMHATGSDAGGKAGAFLEIQLDEDLEAVTQWAAKVGVPVTVTPFLRRAQHTASATLHDVTVHVTAFCDTNEPDEDDGLYC